MKCPSIHGLARTAAPLALTSIVLMQGVSAQCVMDDDLSTATLDTSLDLAAGWITSGFPGPMVQMGPNGTNAANIGHLFETVTLASRQVPTGLLTSRFDVLFDVTPASNGQFHMKCTGNPTFQEIRALIDFDYDTSSQLDGMTVSDPLSGASIDFPLDTTIQVHVIADTAGDVTILLDGMMLSQTPWSQGGSCPSISQLVFGTDPAPMSGGGAFFVDDICVVPANAIGETFGCNSNANSTGVPGALAMYGSSSLFFNDFELQMSSLPPSQFGMPVASMTAVTPFPVNDGLLCIDAGDTTRFLNNVVASNGAGFATTALDLTQPVGPGLNQSIAVGDTWYFQFWHRDTVGTGANFTDGRSILITL